MTGKNKFLKKLELYYYIHNEIYQGLCSIQHYFRIDLKRQKGLKPYKLAEQKVLDFPAVGADFLFFKK